jgi:hypothetical protein
MMRLTVQIAVCCLASLLLLPARGQTVMDWMQAARGAQNLAIPRYSEPEKVLYAVIRVDKVYTEYEKKGFFRIGALPVVVLEGVTYEVKDPAPAATNLVRLRTWLGGDTGRHLELRGVKIVVSPDSRLEGGRLLFLDNDRWQLTGGVRLITGPKELRAESATFRVAGERAGELILQTAPPATNTFLFGSISQIAKPTAINTASK